MAGCRRATSCRTSPCRRPTAARCSNALPINRHSDRGRVGASLGGINDFWAYGCHAKSPIVSRVTAERYVAVGWTPECSLVAMQVTPGVLEHRSCGDREEAVTATGFDAHEVGRLLRLPVFMCAVVSFEYKRHPGVGRRSFRARAFPSPAAISHVTTHALPGWNIRSAQVSPAV
jgi:hypothetical protein